MGKSDHSEYSNDVEIGKLPPLDMNESNDRPFSKMKEEERDHQFTSQDVWTNIAQEEPPTYRRTTESPELRPNSSNSQSIQSGYRSDMHVSYCHYATLIFTIICLCVIIIFYTTAALHRTDPLVLISGLHMTPSRQSCVDTRPSAGISMPAINIEPHFVIAGSSDQSANLSTITNYKTLTETSTTISTLLSTVTINTFADFSPAAQCQSTVTTATTTFISPILQISTVMLTPSSQAPTTVTVTSTWSGCAAFTTSAQTITEATTERSPPPTIQHSTRYFTGPNLVGSILNGP
jgi:hypothetical protein